MLARASGFEVCTATSPAAALTLCEAEAADFGADLTPLGLARHRRL